MAVPHMKAFVPDINYAQVQAQLLRFLESKFLDG
jgi:hypothetical protein